MHAKELNPARISFFLMHSVPLLLSQMWVTLIIQGKRESHEMASASVQIIQEETGVLHQTLQKVCHFQAFICYILNPYPLCVCTGGICEAT